MSVSMQDVISVFWEDQFPKEDNIILRERGRDFVETLISEAEFLTEGSLRYEAEAIGVL